DVAEAFRRAVDDLLDQRPDLILLVGDVFHSVRPTNPAILFLFQQLHRLRAGLPDAPIVMIGGEHDTPRSAETRSILPLYAALAVDVVVDHARRLTYSKLDCSILAVPHQALAQAERPSMRPQRGTTFNVLAVHGQLPGTGERRGTMEYGGAPIELQDLAPAQWDYVALGHYHVAHQVEANAWRRRARPAADRRSPRRSRSSSSTGRSTPTWTAPSSCGSVSSTWRMWAETATLRWRGRGRGEADAVAAAPPRQLPAARRYRARVRSWDHGDHRAE